MVAWLVGYSFIPLHTPSPYERKRLHGFRGTLSCKPPPPPGYIKEFGHGPLDTQALNCPAA
eukprot:1390537-Amphidinium_carterae.1